jgi:hypothetical protein
MSDSEEKSEFPQVLDDAGKIAAFSGPALLANRIYLSLTPISGRLSFVEFPPSDIPASPQFRGAVTMAIGDLIALRDLLEQHLRDAKLLTAGEEDGSSH